MSSQNEDQKWLPTHVQVTVLRGRGLRGKGKHGTSDVYTIIQLGKEKYSTCVVEKTTEPEWREECSFELQPGVLESGGRSAYPAASSELVLTVMHRALIGLDVFLGQAVIQLEKVFHESRCVRNQWYRLNSKTGKKEKERGDIQVTVQFTRNNLTASMYDLVMKDKSASTFSKLKERMRVKRRSSEEDSSSAILPSGSLHRMRQRLPSDGGGEEDYEDDEGGEARRSKMRTFFLRGKLRKSSDTRSSTSLGSESSESSSRGGSLSPTAGISVVVSDLSNSPSNSSNLTADNSPEHTADTSPKSSSLQCEFGDEPSEITIAVPQLSVCVNGSHADHVRPPDSGLRKPAGSLGLGLPQKTLPLSKSLQNLSPRAPMDLPKGTVGDGRRWSFDKPGDEEKAAIATALERSGPMLGEDDEHSGQIDPPTAPWSSSVEAEGRGGKQRKNLLSNGRRESAGKGTSQSHDVSGPAPAATEDKHKGWFGSKDSHSKPRSPSNPFFSRLRCNPFFEDMLTASPLKPSPPPLPYLSSSRPPIAQLFPEARNPNATLTHGRRPREDGSIGFDAERDEVTVPPAVDRFSETPSDRRTHAATPDSEWDESFEVFASDRLQSPKDLTRDDRGTLPAVPDVKDSPHPQPSGVPVGGFTDTNMCHLDMFAHFLGTIPEDGSFEHDDKMFTPSTNYSKPDACADTHALTDTNMHRAACQPSKISSSSPDPASSGLGSSVEEDFLSGLSSYSTSDKFSSSDDTEAQLSESSFLCCEVSPESAVFRRLKRNGSEDEKTDQSNESVVDETNQTVVQHRDDGESTGVEGSGVLTQQTGGDGADVRTPDGPSVVFPDLLSESDLQPEPQSDSQDEDEGELSVSVEDLSQQVHDAAAELCSTHPSVSIITSSPGFSSSPLGSTSGGEEAARQESPGPFGLPGDFLNASRDLDNTLRLTPASDHSSLLQSLYVSSDSHVYQSCQSQPSSEGSSISESFTLCVELNDIHPAGGAASGLGETTDAFRTFNRGRFGGSCVVEDRTAALEQSFTIRDDVHVLPAATTDSCMSCNPKLSEAAVEKQCTGFHDFKCPTLNRSQSEGDLTAAGDTLLLPSFGSDSCTLQVISSAQHGPHLSSLTSFAPSLTPDSRSFPVALRSLSLLSDASARSPPAQQQQQQQQQQQAANQQDSPHPVKPLTTATLAEERRTESRSVLATGLEKLKSTIHPGRSSQPGEQETDRKKFLTDGAGSYYHLTHSELVALLVQREADLERQKVEFRQQKVLLSKRELELRKLKPQVRDLEDYIDTLLVRIMEQKPTLLQVRSKLK